MAQKYKKSNFDSLVPFSTNTPPEFGPKPIEMSENDEEPIFGGNSVRGLFYKLRLNIRDYPYAVDSDAAYFFTVYKL